MKLFNKNILFFILGTVFAFSLDVAAETLIDSGAISYTNVATNETNVKGALNELFSAVDINQKIGDMSQIKSLGGGTITGAINELNNNILNMGIDYTASSVISNIGLSSKPTKNSEEKFVAPSNGIVYVEAYKETPTSSIFLMVNGIAASYSGAMQAYSNAHLYGIVSKGDVITLITDAETEGWNVSIQRFIAAK